MTMLQPLAAERTANTFNDRHQFFQKIAALPSGGYVVVWMSDQVAGTMTLPPSFSAPKAPSSAAGYFDFAAHTQHVRARRALGRASTMFHFSGF